MKKYLRYVQKSCFFVPWTSDLGIIIIIQIILRTCTNFDYPWESFHLFTCLNANSYSKPLSLLSNLNKKEIIVLFFFLPSSHRTFYLKVRHSQNWKEVFYFRWVLWYQISFSICFFFVSKSLEENMNKKNSTYIERKDRNFLCYWLDLVSFWINFTPHESILFLCSHMQEHVVHIYIYKFMSTKEFYFASRLMLHSNKNNSAKRVREKNFKRHRKQCFKKQEDLVHETAIMIKLYVF